MRRLHPIAMPLLLLSIAHQYSAILIAAASYRRRAGAVAGAGRGAPVSPIIPAILVVLVASAAILIFVIVRHR